MADWMGFPSWGTTLELVVAGDALTLIKVLQLIPMGLGGLFMATDILHGKARPLCHIPRHICMHVLRARACTCTCSRLIRAALCVILQVRGDMVPNMGFPSWFPTLLGLFKLAFVATNWADGGAHTPVAQAMMAFHTGGAA